MHPKPVEPHLTKHIARICTAVAHAQRVEIVLALDAGERDVTSICEALGCSQSRTSQQLALLRRAGVVTTRRDGRRIYYRLVDSRAAHWVRSASEFRLDRSSE